MHIYQKAKAPAALAAIKQLIIIGLFAKVAHSVHTQRTVTVVDDKAQRGHKPKIDVNVSRH